MLDFMRWGLSYTLPVLVLFAGYMPDIEITPRGIFPQAARIPSTGIRLASLGFMILGYLGLSWGMWIVFSLTPPWYQTAVCMAIYGWVGWSISPYFVR